MVQQRVQRTARDRLVQRLPVAARQVDVDGATTSVLEGGKGPPLVLLHGGIQAGGLVWWRAIPRLAERHRVVVPDMPGLGESEPVAPGLDAASVVDWLERVVRLTCHERPTLVAHSAPGALAARFALRHGDLLQRLVLVDAAGLGTFRPSPGFLVALVRANLRPSEHSLERFLGRVLADIGQVREPDGERWAAFVTYLHSRAVVPTVKQAMREVVKAGTTRIPDTELERLTVPTALLWGRDDPLIPLRLGEAASARHGWPLRVVDGAGHLPHVERPAAFVEALVALTDAA